jgi:predicted RNA polymerase sigma factor
VRPAAPKETPAGMSRTGPTLQRTDLTTEAVRLARLLHRLLPDDGEVAGLLALMLLTDARRAARTDRASGGPHKPRDQSAAGPAAVRASRARK